MSKFFEQLKEGLEEVLAYKEGKITLRSEMIEIPEPPISYTHRDSKIGFGQRGSSDFLAGTRDSAKGTGRSEDEKYEAKPTSGKTNF